MTGSRRWKGLFLTILTGMVAGFIQTFEGTSYRPLQNDSEGMAVHAQNNRSNSGKVRNIGPVWRIYRAKMASDYRAIIRPFLVGKDLAIMVSYRSRRSVRMPSSPDESLHISLPLKKR